MNSVKQVLTESHFAIDLPILRCVVGKLGQHFRLHVEKDALTHGVTSLPLSQAVKRCSSRELRLRPAVPPGAVAACFAARRLSPLGLGGGGNC